MAKIIEVNLPDEYKNKNKYEIFVDLEQVASLATYQKQQIEDLKGEVKLKNAQMIKMRGDILKLKSMIGHQKMKIEELELESDTIDIEVEVEKNEVHFQSTGIEFEQVKQPLPKL